MAALFTVVFSVRHIQSGLTELSIHVNINLITLSLSLESSP